jgi:hypothetical protein
MQSLAQDYLSIISISGGGCRGGVGGMAYSLVGMTIGLTMGAKLYTPALPYFVDPNQGYINGAKSAVTDYVIAMKYGHLGITTKTDVVGGLSGALLGSIIGSAVFGALN